MCKTITYRYTCGHSTPFRLSTCSGTFSYRPNLPKAARVTRCRGNPNIAIQSQQDCGICQKEAAQYDLEKAHRRKIRRRALLNTTSHPRAAAHIEIDDAKVAYKAEQKVIAKTFPDGLHKRFAPPDWMDAEYRASLRNSSGKRATSPLKVSFKPEDMVNEESEEDELFQEFDRKVFIGRK